MPRPSKGIRLWLEPAEYDGDGRIARHSAWVIRDGSRKIRTGFLRENREGADKALAEYIAARDTRLPASAAVILLKSWP